MIGKGGRDGETHRDRNCVYSVKHVCCSKHNTIYVQRFCTFLNNDLTLMLLMLLTHKTYFDEYRGGRRRGGSLLGIGSDGRGRERWGDRHMQREGVYSDKHLFCSKHNMIYVHLFCTFFE